MFTITFPAGLKTRNPDTLVTQDIRKMMAENKKKVGMSGFFHFSGGYPANNHHPDIGFCTLCVHLITTKYGVAKIIFKNSTTKKDIFSLIFSYSKE